MSQFHHIFIKFLSYFCHNYSHRDKILTAIFIFFSTWFVITIITSSGDLQPSTAIANQLPGQLVSTQIRTTRPNCFKFIIALIMTSTNIV